MANWPLLNSKSKQHSREIRKTRGTWPTTLPAKRQVTDSKQHHRGYTQHHTNRRFWVYKLDILRCQNYAQHNLTITQSHRGDNDKGALIQLTRASLHARPLARVQTHQPWRRTIGPVIDQWLDPRSRYSRTKILPSYGSGRRRPDISLLLLCEIIWHIPFFVENLFMLNKTLSLSCVIVVCFQSQHDSRAWLHAVYCFVVPTALNDWTIYCWLVQK